MRRCSAQVGVGQAEQAMAIGSPASDAPLRRCLQVDLQGIDDAHKIFDLTKSGAAVPLKT
jgi:hypothetical protein